jgi:branched-subunit amino acid transport protein
VIAASPGWPYLVVGILGLMVVTFLSRASFFLLPQRISLPAQVERALRYAPACAVMAIIVPSVMSRDRELVMAWDNYQMWAVVAGTALFYVRRNMLLMMVTTITVYTVLRLYA